MRDLRLKLTINDLKLLKMTQRGKGPFINDVTEKGGGGVPPKGDQKMTGGRGGICKR